MNLKKSFFKHCEKNQFEVNKNQLDIIENLHNFYRENFNQSYLIKFFKKKNRKFGFYLVGEVGVGKTMILNFFFNQLKEKKLRLHFNEFMINFHDFVFKNKNQENVIDLFVKNLKDKTKIIYFDEFQVTNIVDAMILGKLFKRIFEEKIKVIFTSNTHVSNLYKDGLQRDQFKPFIKIMEDQSFQYELVIEDDYRKSNNSQDRYFFPLDEETNFKINKFFRTITKDKVKTEKIINVKGRNFKIENFYEGVARFDFKTLCDQNLGAEDYLEIIKNCVFIVIDQIPQFDNFNSNQQQRFITLLDIIYDNSVPIAVTSNQSLDKFTSSKLLEKPFERTISRLYELTSKVMNS